MDVFLKTTHMGKLYFCSKFTPWEQKYFGMQTVHVNMAFDGRVMRDHYIIDSSHLLWLPKYELEYDKTYKITQYLVRIKIISSKMCEGSDSVKVVQIDQWSRSELTIHKGPNWPQIKGPNRPRSESSKVWIDDRWGPNWPRSESSKVRIDHNSFSTPHGLNNAIKKTFHTWCNVNWVCIQIYHYRNIFIS